MKRHRGSKHLTYKHLKLQGTSTHCHMHKLLLMQLLVLLVEMVWLGLVIISGVGGWGKQSSLAEVRHMQPDTQISALCMR